MSTFSLSITEAKEQLASMKQALEDIGGYDKSGYLPLRIDVFELAISNHEENGGIGDVRISLAMS